ncbi:hypothetical protein [Hafnia alvei]|uniref:hypothetical protein n=1 Tax=Hafnia alvei TaxID=569 RepID=UPI0024A887FA|nr:hypothetical protein [Hafnia alvei]
MMFRYLNLRFSQQVLCYIYSLPLALFYTFAFSPVGTWSGSLFFSLFVLLTALGWAVLAFHLRRLDRLRRENDAMHVFLRQGKRVVGQIKRQTKAQLEWDILHDNAVIGRQLRGWIQGVVRYTGRAILYSPAFVLLSAGITFAFMPDVSAELVSQLRTCPAQGIVRFVAVLWVDAIFITWNAVILAHVVTDNFPPDCFHDELLLRAKKLSSCSSGSDAHFSQPSLGEEK